MNVHQAEHAMQTWPSFDLMEFDSPDLSSAGELSLPRDIKHDVLLKLGTDLLALSRIPLATPDASDGPVWDSQVGATNAYLLRNLHTDASLLFADEQTTKFKRDVPGVGMVRFREGQEFVIGRGRDATPELQLSPSTSRHHAAVRVGQLQRNLHFMDLGSTNGTTIFTHEEDRQGFLGETRVWLVPKRSRLTGRERRGGPQTVEGLQGAWSR